jgi:hypothetical protein
MDKLYYYFIKTKYLKWVDSDLKGLKTNFDKFRDSGITIETLPIRKRAAIEIGLLGKELSKKHRHVDNYILKNNFIVDCFVEDNLSCESKLKRLAGELLKS